MNTVVRKYAIFCAALGSLVLTACSSTYQAFNERYVNPYGYQETLLNKDETPLHYLLTYEGKSGDPKSVITEYWHQRAKELCVDGYDVIRHHQGVIHGSIRTPVNGLMVTLGTQTPIDKGEIRCKTNNGNNTL